MGSGDPDYAGTGQEDVYYGPPALNVVISLKRILELVRAKALLILYAAWGRPPPEEQFCGEVARLKAALYWLIRSRDQSASVLHPT